MLCIAGTDGYFKVMNHAWERTLGWKTQELKASPALSFVHRDDAERTSTELQRLGETVPAVSFVNRFRCSNGSFRSLRWSVTRGQQDLIHVVARDVTEFQQAVADAQKNDELWQAILRTAVDPIIVIDQDGIMLRANAATTRLFKYEREELLGNNVSLLMPEPYHSEHDQYLGRYLQTGEARIIGIGREVQGRRKDGTTFPMALAVSEIVTQSGRMFTGMIHDLTPRQAAEQQLRNANETLEERVRERTAELQASMEELANAEVELRRMQDRERIGRDLHDTVIQRLFATGMGLQSLTGRTDDVAIRQRINESVEEIDEGIKQLREAIFRLHHSSPDPISDEITRTAEAKSMALGFTPRVQVAPNVDEIPDSVRHDLISTLQEALSNVIKHANATDAEVIVDLQQGDLVLRVIDNGIGVGSASSQVETGHDALTGRGLENMRQRATQRSGTFELVSGSDGGTELRWRAPIPTET